jgi:MYXO-CTERM domain-containing protein
MHKTTQLLMGAAAVAAFLSFPSSARAGIEACGDIHVEAEAHCEMSGGIECEAKCTPVTVEAACAAELHASCEGQCNASLEAQCAVDCEAACTGQCDADPGDFDCSASCQGDCEGNCNASCGDNECEASCVATCSAECSASCEGRPPSATCEAKCEGSCEGQCTAEANFDCQINCQAEGYAECKVDIQGGCEAACNTEDGALFCDGQYVDHGGNLEECIDALKNLFDIEVEGWASAECEGGKCEAEAGGLLSCTCSAGDLGNRTAALALFALGLLALSRRRPR